MLEYQAFADHIGKGLRGTESDFGPSDTEPYLAVRLANFAKLSERSDIIDQELNKKALSRYVVSRCLQQVWRQQQRSPYQLTTAISMDNSDYCSKPLTEVAVDQAATSTSLAQQTDIVLKILGLLPDSHKAAVAKLLCKAAYHELKEYRRILVGDCGDLPTVCLLDFLRQHGDNVRQQRQLMAALARQGDLPRLHFVRNHGCACDESACYAAAGAGHLAVLQWLRSLDPPCPWSHSCAAAAEGGHMQVLQWLRSQDPPCPWSSVVCLAAAKGGHIPVLQWLRAQNPPCDWGASVCEAAAKHGHLSVLQWLRAQNPPCPWYHNKIPHVCEAAAAGGHLEILQWLRAQTPPCSWGSCPCEEAAFNGHFEVLQWLRAQNPPCHWSWHNMCHAAAYSGNLEMLQWLRAQDPPCFWSARACAAAASKGHLAMLQWMRAQDPPCDWDGDTCVSAGIGGHLEVLQWALAQDPPVPWDPYVCIWAADQGHLHILQWVAEQQPSLAWDIEACLRVARRHNAKAIVKWLESLPDETDSE